MTPAMPPLPLWAVVIGVGVISLIGVMLMMITLIRQQANEETERITRHRLRTAYCRYPACNCPLDAPADAEWCARGLPHDPRGFPHYDREET